MNHPFKIGQQPIINSASFPIGMDAFLLALLPGNLFKQPATILDACAGSGIVSVVLNKKFNQSNLFAIELDKAAITECTENYQTVHLNPAQIVQGDITNSNCFEHEQFTHIFLNPPYFFEPTQSREWAKAKHNTIQTAQAMLISISTWLHKNGVCCIILPAHQIASWRRLCVQANLYISEIYPIAPYQDKEPNRYILKLTKEFQLQAVIHPKFDVMQKHSVYSSAYIHLTKSILCLEQ